MTADSWPPHRCPAQHSTVRQMWVRAKASPGLVRVDQEFLAGGTLVVDSDVGELQRLLQRHHLRIMAGKGGLELVDNALTQFSRVGRTDLLQERQQQPAADTPGHAECPVQLDRTRIQAAIDIDL